MAQLIADRYVVIADGDASKEIQVGGMSHVAKVVDTKSGQTCAIKFAQPNGDQSDATESFDREYRALKRLSDGTKHPNIISLLDSGRDDIRGLYLVLEWIQRDLMEWLNEKGKYSTWRSFYQQIGRPLLDALAHAHSIGIAHRDVKLLISTEF